jgi:hypothetical protein
MLFFNKKVYSNDFLFHLKKKKKIIFNEERNSLFCTMAKTDHALIPFFVMLQMNCG